jgi:hypothetical protein
MMVTYVGIIRIYLLFYGLYLYSLFLTFFVLFVENKLIFSFVLFFYLLFFYNNFRKYTMSNVILDLQHLS